MTRQRRASTKQLTCTVLLLAAAMLVPSCAGPSPTAEPLVTVSAASPVTGTTVEVSPTLPTTRPLVSVSAVAPTTGATVEVSLAAPTVEPPESTPTPTAVIPTVASATLEASPTPPAVATPALTATAAISIPVCTVRVIAVYPHDRAAFTQGLVFENEGFYEGTGLNGQSTLRRVELESGRVLQALSLPPQYFAEGITIWEDRIVQLTLKSGLGFVYDKESFELLDTFRYPTEGWGITHDGTRLIMSDGTPTLHFWDPETFEETGSVGVYGEAGAVTWLNELEYVQGMVYANVWQTDFIAIIEPHTGQVTAWIDLRGLLEPEDYAEPVDVLNGIAYDDGSGRLFVTGKLWPKVFEIELISPAGAPASLTCR